MITLDHIDVIFDSGEQAIHAVKNVSIKVERGDIYGVVGYSGAGKSTLVRTINLLQKPTNGSVTVNGQDMLALSSRELRQARKKIGMIFQHFNLMMSRTVAGNILYALRGSGLSKEEKTKRVHELLELVELSDKHDAYPAQLSGGQKQRVGIARALANEPEVLLCDEATSALDPKTTNSILNLLKNLNKQLGLTIVVITHEMEAIKEICNKVAVMERGEVIEEGNIVQIFTDPANPLTKEFIDTALRIDQALDKLSQQSELMDLDLDSEIVKLAFKSDNASDPIIKELYRRFEVNANIIYGNVEVLNHTLIGHLIVILKGPEARRYDAYDYLDAHDISVQLLEYIDDGDEKKIVPKQRRKR